MWTHALLLVGASALVAPRAGVRASLSGRSAGALRAAAVEAGGGASSPAALKARILHFGAVLDRGQGYNPTSGRQYEDRMASAVAAVDALCAADSPPPTHESLAGDWELIFSSVKHGIFRSSPFFLAIEEAYRSVGAPEKAELFFKLHELQTCSWGVSKIGRVGQTFDADAKMMYSEFDTQIFALTVIPFLGWGKLLPTFGGRVVTASSYALDGRDVGVEVDYTTAKPVDGLAGLGEWIWKLRVPVGAVWKLLPWNRGRPPTATLAISYIDDDFRVVKDAGGEYFVYARPLA